MELNDALQKFKVYREITALVEPDRKSTQQGVEITAQSTVEDMTEGAEVWVGDYTMVNAGDEASWGYTAPKDNETRNALGSYSQAIPALLKTEGGVFVIKDKTQALDADYASKTESGSAGNSSSSVRVAEETAAGTPGIICTCLNGASQEQIFFPMGAGKIKVDNINSPDTSTKIYDTLTGGEVSTTNIGKTSDILQIESSVACIKVLSQFTDYTGTKNGMLDFSTGAFPSTVTPETPANYEVKCEWSAGANRWKWYAIAEATESQTYYAKIAWNYTVTSGDFSRGELYNYDASTDAFSATGTGIWIDTLKSAQCQFSTAGNTVFVVRLVRPLITRSAVEMDMYYVVQAVKDDVLITHFRAITLCAGNVIDAYLESDTLGDPLTTTCKIQTTLVSVAYDNKLAVRVPSEWKVTSSAKNWTVTAVHDFSRGIKFWAEPIRPRLTDVSNKYYECASATSITYEKVGGGS